MKAYRDVCAAVVIFQMLSTIKRKSYFVLFVLNITLYLQPFPYIYKIV